MFLNSIKNIVSGLTNRSKSSNKHTHGVCPEILDFIKRLDGLFSSEIRSKIQELEERLETIEKIDEFVLGLTEDTRRIKVIILVKLLILLDLEKVAFGNFQWLALVAKLNALGVDYQLVSRSLDLTKIRIEKGELVLTGNPLHAHYFREQTWDTERFGINFELLGDDNRYARSNYLFECVCGAQKIISQVSFV